MSATEQEMLETILKAFPKMSDFQRGRLYGIAEAMEELNMNRTKESKGEEKS